MERLQFIPYKDKTILLEDFSGMKPGEAFFTLLQQAGEMIRSQPEKSVLALFDASGSHFNNELLDAVKTFTEQNTPYVKAAAVVGISGLLKIALKSVSKFSGREFHLFDSREEAMEWLISQ